MCEAVSQDAQSLHRRRSAGLACQSSLVCRLSAGLLHALPWHQLDCEHWNGHRLTSQYLRHHADGTIKPNDGQRSPVHCDSHHLAPLGHLHCAASTEKPNKAHCSRSSSKSEQLAALQCCSIALRLHTDLQAFAGGYGAPGPPWRCARRLAQQRTRPCPRSPWCCASPPVQCLGCSLMCLAGDAGVRQVEECQPGRTLQSAQDSSTAELAMAKQLLTCARPHVPCGMLTAVPGGECRGMPGGGVPAWMKTTGTHRAELSMPWPSSACLGLSKGCKRVTHVQVAESPCKA